MNNVKAYIESGTLEMYVLGAASHKDNEEVMQMARQHSAIKMEIEKISLALYRYFSWYSIQPPSAIKVNLLKLIKERTRH